MRQKNLSHGTFADQLLDPKACDRGSRTDFPGAHEKLGSAFRAGEGLSRFVDAILNREESLTSVTTEFEFHGPDKSMVPCDGRWRKKINKRVSLEGRAFQPASRCRKTGNVFKYQCLRIHRGPGWGVTKIGLRSEPGTLRIVIPAAHCDAEILENCTSNGLTLFWRRG